MRVTSVVAIALSAVLVSPAVAYAEHSDTDHHPDPVCATDGTNCQPSTHVVKRGEWLWKIARLRLAAAGKSTAPKNVRKIADMIYADNRRVIGPTKNRLMVGQRLSIRHRDQWPI